MKLTSLETTVQPSVAFDLSYVFLSHIYVCGLCAVCFPVTGLSMGGLCALCLPVTGFSVCGLCAICFLSHASLCVTCVPCGSCHRPLYVCGLCATCFPSQGSLWVACVGAFLICATMTTMCSFVSPYGYHGMYIQRRNKKDHKGRDKRNALRLWDNIWYTFAGWMQQVGALETLA